MLFRSGAEHIIIATDAGQKQNPWWYEELEDSIARLERNGVTKREIDLMTKANPANVLGIGSAERQRQSA